MCNISSFRGTYQRFEHQNIPIDPNQFIKNLSAFWVQFSVASTIRPEFINVGEETKLGTVSLTQFWDLVLIKI